MLCSGAAYTCCMMTTTVSPLLDEGRAALKRGDKAAAKVLLTQLVEQDERSEDGWLWLSAAVDSPDDQRICLENVLQINPDNRIAQHGLTDLAPVPPVLDTSAPTAALTRPPEAPPDLVACGACGQQNHGARKFCTRCGASLMLFLQPAPGPAAVASTAATVVPPGPGRVPPPPRPPLPTMSAVPPPYNPPRPPVSDAMAYASEPAPQQGNAISKFFTFRTLISHTLIQIVYVLGLLFITFTGGLLLLNGNLTAGAGWLILGNIGWRVVCEWMILFYSMHQRLVGIERELQQHPQ
jgi:hypothetical protein